MKRNGETRKGKEIIYLALSENVVSYSTYKIWFSKSFGMAISISRMKNVLDKKVEDEELEQLLEKNQ